MTVVFHLDQVKADLAKKVGQTLLRMAVLIQTEMKKRMNVSNERGKRPSPVDSFLHKGSGVGQASVVYSPTTPAGVAKEGRVRVGYQRSGWYVGYWTLPDNKHRRKGLVECVEEVRGQLQALGVKN